MSHVVTAVALTLLTLEAPRVALADGDTRLEVAAFSSDASIAAIGGSATPALHVDQIWLGFRDPVFRDQASCVAREHSAGGSHAAELVAQTVDAVPLEVTPRTHYCAVTLALRRIQGHRRRGRSSLDGATVLVRGHLDDGTRVVVRSTSRLVFRFDASDPGGFTVSDGARLMLAADVATWFADVDLTTADLDTDDGERVIRIDDRRNPAILAAFEAAVSAGLGLYQDADRDGALDRDEIADDELASPR